MINISRLTRSFQRLKKLSFEKPVLEEAERHHSGNCDRMKFSDGVFLGKSAGKPCLGLERELED